MKVEATKRMIAHAKNVAKMTSKASIDSKMKVEPRTWMKVKATTIIVMWMTADEDITVMRKTVKVSNE